MREEQKQVMFSVCFSQVKYSVPDETRSLPACCGTLYTIHDRHVHMSSGCTTNSRSLSASLLTGEMSKFYGTLHVSVITSMLYTLYMLLSILAGSSLCVKLLYYLQAKNMEISFRHVGRLDTLENFFFSLSHKDEMC